MNGRVPAKHPDGWVQEIIPIRSGIGILGRVEVFNPCGVVDGDLVGTLQTESVRGDQGRIELGKGTDQS